MKDIKIFFNIIYLLSYLQLIIFHLN